MHLLTCHKGTLQYQTKLSLAYFLTNHEMITWNLPFISVINRTAREGMQSASYKKKKKILLTLLHVSDFNVLVVYIEVL